MQPMQIHGLITEGTRESWQVVDRAAGAYRYLLGRCWEPDNAALVRKPIFSIVMFNPSVADHMKDDPTIRMCIHFAKQEGCGALLVRNLFAYRATQPVEVEPHYARVREVAWTSPLGPNDDRYDLLTAIRTNRFILSLEFMRIMHVAAWGAFKSDRMRRFAHTIVGDMSMKERVQTIFVLGDKLTKGGDPRHPLYLPKVTRVVLWKDAA